MINIRPAVLKDLQPLQILFEEYRQFYSMPPAKKQSIEFLQQRLERQDSVIIMAFDEQIAAGFVQIYPTYSSVAMRPIWILNDLFVNQNHRQKGIARKLMQAVELEAKSQAIFSVKLATQVNNTKAKSLYESLGYKLINQFDHYSKKI